MNKNKTPSYNLYEGVFMIIFFNKKRILTVTICLVLSFFLAGIREKKETIETVALPVEDKVIIIDAGHGLPDSRSL